MPKFILVDHSLRDAGGHHHPYALSVLQAAAAAGFAPVLATHRSFDARASLPAGWPVHALFPDVSYSPLTLDTQSGRASLQRGWRRIVAPLLRVAHGRARARHASRFAHACAQLFERLQPDAGDLVFLPTASELDLQGLARFIAAAPALPALRWHAQLHFGIHAQRDWRRRGDADAAARMAASLRQSLQVLAPAGLRLWCTTEPLAEQYRALGIASFMALPYPVHPSFSRERAFRPAPLPARIACLGHARREKNQRLLPALLEALWPQWFAPGRAQLVVQNARPALRTELEQAAQRLASQGATLQAGSRPGPDAAQAALDLAAGTLDQDHYARLVAGSDVGLLLYDARRYHDRCSGVLLEMRVAGVPVIVPARSWLADQIESANQEWLERTVTELADSSRLRAERNDAGAASLPVPEDATALLLTRHWPAGTLPADGCALTCEQLDASGQVLEREALWLEARAAAAPTRCLVTLRDGCRAVRLAASLELQREWIIGPAPPRAALGLAIVSADDATASLRDILQHIGHYKRHAAAVAEACAAQCSSARIVAQLQESA